MKFKISREAIKRFFLYGAFPEPFNKRYGNGWVALLLGAAHRASPMGLLTVAVYLPLAPTSTFNLTPIFALAVFFIYCVFFERHLIRRAGGGEAFTRTHADGAMVWHQLFLSSIRAFIVFLIYMGIYSSIEKLTPLDVDQTLSSVIAVISFVVGAFLHKIYRPSGRTP
ncbi:hypothetical protein [Burkholderia guangdongensis]|uniref:hypothetical protein n=1 Tax=Burkholderia guangdongensis TaxID=1792500 RepID=UPI0015C85436|nr:hypothetical protein [Burkholderia guangdongensis]